MQKILAYHPVIEVRERDGRVSALCGDLPDFEEDGSILRKLCGRLSVGTVGEVVEAVRRGEIAGWRIDPAVSAGVRRIWGWAERI